MKKNKVVLFILLIHSLMGFGQVKFQTLAENSDFKSTSAFKDVTDFIDTITVKMFAKNDQLPDLLEFIKEGNFIKIKGIVVIDKYDK